MLYCSDTKEGLDDDDPTPRNASLTPLGDRRDTPRKTRGVYTVPVEVDGVLIAVWPAIAANPFSFYMILLPPQKPKYLVRVGLMVDSVPTVTDQDCNNIKL